MTSPISLLAMLGGTTADPAGPTEGEDPALFAAALVSALQQLQPPVKLVVPVTPVVVECEVEGEAAEGDVPSSENPASETLGQMLDATEVATGEATLGADQPKATSAAASEPAPPGMMLDVASDEPARPTAARPEPDPSTVPTAELARSPKRAVVKLETAAQPTNPMDVPAGSTSEPAADAESPDCADQAADLKSDPPNAAPVRKGTRTANKGELLVGDWSPPPPAFTGWKAPVEQVKAEAPKGGEDDRDGASEAQPSQVAPVQVTAPAQVIIAQLPVATNSVMPQPLPVEERGQPAPVPSAPLPDHTVDLESPDDAVRQVQVANARLAAQLAELVGDRNVTDFRVQLGKGKREAEAPGTPVVKLPVEEPAAPATQPLAKAPLVRQGELANQPVAVTPRPTKTETPVPVERPIVPALRQEIPAASPSAKPSAPVATEKTRPRDDSPSEPPAAASSVNQNQRESLTSRSESSETRGSREARNLPQEGSGNDRPAGSADRVTVQVSDSEGRQTRIRVSVLGDQVRAVIVPPDSESARQLEQRMDDLQTALARQGFAGSKVMVQPAGETAVERNGASLAGMASGAESKAASPGKDQPAGDQRQGRGQREQQHPGDGHRHPNGRSRDQGAEHRRRFTDV